MKSTSLDLRRRGRASEHDVTSLSGVPIDELIRILHGKDAPMRSAAATVLSTYTDSAADELLTQLVAERCLYTRIAICESLQKGTIETAVTMTRYLGEIGNNQHKKLPDRVSAKKSYPLPRDIVARTLARMDTDIFPALIAVLKTKDVKKIREVLDALGFMVFYHPNLATQHNLDEVLSVMSTHQSDVVIV